MIRKAMALAVGLGLVAAVGTQASAQPGHPTHGAYGYRGGGGWHGRVVYRGPVYRGGWGYGYGYAPHRVWYPGYWAVRPWGRVWIAGCWR